MANKFEIGEDFGGGEDAKENLQRKIRDNPYFQHLNDDAPKNGQNGMLPWLKVVEVVEAERTSDSTARIVYRFPVQREYLNPKMTLHGGLAGGLFDTATTWLLSLVRKPGFWWNFGISRSLNITYLRPAVEGEMLLMETEIVHAGKKLCLLKAVLMREKDRAIISTCEHQKYNIDADAARM